MRPRAAAVWLAVVAALACGAAPEAVVLDLPARPADAPGGAELARSLRGLELEAREARIVAEVARGNVPGWLRALEPLELEVAGEDGARRMTFWAAPDYLALGSDDDYLFVPVSPGTARRIAALAGGALPTPGMVDAVWSSARVRVVPIRMQPNEDIWSVDHFVRHSRLVQAQRRQHGGPPGALAAGHKLDVVQAPDVALYGWHFPDGTPLQPVHAVPADLRPHFSMGLRLVHREVLVDGAPADLGALLRDPELAGALGTRG